MTTMSSGDTYRHLSEQCRMRSWRLLLRLDAKRTKASKLKSLEVHDKEQGLLVKVAMGEHTLDSAAAVALAGLEKRGEL